MIYSFGCVLSLFGSLDSHLLMGVFPKMVTTKDTWTPVWKWFTWSFEALQKGYHPSQGPDGEPLEKGSPFYPYKGKPLADNFKALQLGLPHWAAKAPCHQCNCTGKTGALPYTVLDPAVFKFVDTKMAKACKKSNHPIFSIGGVTTRMVRGDGLHILFTKGLYAHLLGSCLHYMCWFDPIGTIQTVKPAKRLGVLFTEVQKFYKLQGAGTQLTNLRLSMFTSETSPHQSYAFLHAKGGGMQVVGTSIAGGDEKAAGA